MLFALNASRSLGESAAKTAGIGLSEHEEREFEDGEHKSRPLVNVRDRDVYVLHSLYGEPGCSANDKLCRLAFFCGALKDAAAGRVTAIVPYLCYARKERKTKPRDPVTTRYVAGMLESVGIDRVVGLDVHDLASFQNAYRVARTEHLEARRMFVGHVAGLRGPVAVVSPDAGGLKRVQRFGEALTGALGAPVQLAFMEKRRSGGVVSGEALVGDVAGRTAVIVDDLVASGGTLVRAAEACRNAGAVAVHAMATHGLFVGDAGARLRDAPIDRIVVTDSVPPFRLGEDARRKLLVLPIGPLIGDAIRQMTTGGSLEGT